MKDKLKVVRVANTLALTVGVAYLVCIIAVLLAPGLTTTIGNYLFHGIDISSLIVERSLGYSVITLITGTIAGWLIGAVFAVIYNKLN